MANFNEAYDKTMGYEGGYSNDPTDSGGETYKGISRKYNPNWVGWSVIDSMKGSGFPKNLDSNSDLLEAVQSFYKSEYWDSFWGDKNPSQHISNKLFDIAVNMGKGRASMFLQKALNVLNRNGAPGWYADLKEDGSFGSGTQSALTFYLSKDKDDYILKLLNIFQGYHYVEYMLKDKTQEKYARGWLERIDITIE